MKLKNILLCISIFSVIMTLQMVNPKFQYETLETYLWDFISTFLAWCLMTSIAVVILWLISIYGMMTNNANRNRTGETGETDNRTEFQKTAVDRYWNPQNYNQFGQKKWGK